MAGLALTTHEVADTRLPTETTQVVSSPVNAFVAPVVDDATKLASALGLAQDAIKPWADKKTAEQTVADQEAGKLKRVLGGDYSELTNKHQQDGYNSHDGYLTGEAKGKQLSADWEVAPKKDANGMPVVYDEWYKEWSATNLSDQTQRSPEYLTKFNSVFGQNLADTQGKAVVNAISVKNQDNLAMLSQSASGSFAQMLGTTSLTKPMTAQALNDMVVHYASDFGVDRLTAEKQIYASATDYATNTGDVRAIQAFQDLTRDGKSELGTKMLAGGELFSQKMHSDLVGATSAAYTAGQQKIAMDNASNTAIRYQAIHAAFPIIANASESDLIGLSQKMFDAGLYKNIAEANTDMAAYAAMSKRAETPVQQSASLGYEVQAIKGKLTDPTAVMTLLARHEISYEGAEKILGRISTYSAQQKTEAGLDKRAAKASQMTQPQLLSQSETVINRQTNPFVKFLKDDPNVNIPWQTFEDGRTRAILRLHDRAQGSAPENYGEVAKQETLSWLPTAEIGVGVSIDNYPQK